MSYNTNAYDSKDPRAPLIDSKSYRSPERYVDRTPMKLDDSENRGVMKSTAMMFKSAETEEMTQKQLEGDTEYQKKMGIVPKQYIIQKMRAERADEYESEEDFD